MFYSEKLIVKEIEGKCWIIADYKTFKEQSKKEIKTNNEPHQLLLINPKFDEKNKKMAFKSKG